MTRKNPVAPGVPIDLDRTRRLRFDFNALAAIEEETGASTLDEAFWTDSAMSARRLRAVLWAGLLHEDPGLTLEQVGAMMLPGRLEGIADAIATATAQSMAEAEEGGGPPRRGAKARKTPAG